MACAGAAYAVPALPGLMEIAQPDGSTIKARLMGDEHYHYYTDAAGRPLAPDAAGYLRPAERIPAPTREQREARALPRKASDSKYTSYPTKGHQKALILLVEYSDNSFTFGYDYFNRMLNETGYNTYGSARDYYVENSGGNFLPDFDVYGPVKLAHPMSYYSANDDAKAFEMVVEASRALDGDINFADYDRDGDGWVDNIYVFYAGYGEADGGGVNTVWPHSSNVYRKGTTLRLDGVQIGQYACSNELIANSRQMVGIGTFCHEFGHVLGLPDLYSTSDAGIVTPGYWSLMDHGNYANNGRCPVAMTAYERYYLGWADPMTLTDKSAIRLPSIDKNLGLRINGSDAEEYFLLEYRQKSGWDSYAPGEGLLVWHIDYDRDAWNMNTVNNTESHQRVRILPADGSRTTIGDAGDTYPGTTGATTIGDFKSWNGASSGIALSDIALDGDFVTFKVNGGAASPESPTFSISDVTDCEATASFTGGQGLLVSVSYTQDGRTRYFPGHTFLGVDNGRIALEGLTPSTAYTLTAYASDGAALSTPTQKTFTTAMPGIRFKKPENVAATSVTSTGFTLEWDALEGASGYRLTVWHDGSAAGEESIVDFADKTNLPEGWTTTATATMSVSGYYGAAAPSLRMSNNAEMIESPLYEEPIQSLSFWLRGYQAASGNALEIYGLIDGEWTLLERETGIDNTAGKTFSYGETTLRGAKALRMSYSSTGGSLCLDDIRVGLGDATVEEKDMDKADIGNRTSYTVEGLSAGTTYRAILTATDGSHESLPSQTIEVTTAGASTGLESPATADETYSIHDIAGRLISTGSQLDLSSLPKGIYIIKSRNGSKKILVK